MIDRPNQVWCADITYIPMRRGFLYLVAIMDWYSRKVLASRLSNSMEADFCVEALKETQAQHGKPPFRGSDSTLTSNANAAADKVAALQAEEDVFDPALAGNPDFVLAITAAYALLVTQGAQAAVRYLSVEE